MRKHEIESKDYWEVDGQMMRKWQGKNMQIATSQVDPVGNVKRYCGCLQHHDQRRGVFRRVDRLSFGNWFWAHVHLWQHSWLGARTWLARSSPLIEWKSHGCNFSWSFNASSRFSRLQKEVCAGKWTPMGDALRCRWISHSLKSLQCCWFLARLLQGRCSFIELAGNDVG